MSGKPPSLGVKKEAVTEGRKKKRLVAETPKNSVLIPRNLGKSEAISSTEKKKISTIHSTGKSISEENQKTDSVPGKIMGVSLAPKGERGVDT